MLTTASDLNPLHIHGRPVTSERRRWQCGKRGR